MEKTPLFTFPVANDLCFHKDLQSQKTGVELIHLPDIRSTSDMPQKGSKSKEENSSMEMLLVLYYIHHCLYLYYARSMS